MDPNREREFEQLYRECYPFVYSFVFYRMAGDVAVEDVVAEAFLKAARNFHRYDPTRSKFSTWVVAIAKNCANSHYRKLRIMSPLDDVPESRVAVPGEQDGVDDRELAKQLLGVLAEEDRELVFLKYYGGMLNVEIAERLGLNASTGSTRLARAIAKMRSVVG